MSKPTIPWMNHVKAVEKHLEKNEKYFQYPEKKIAEWELEMNNLGNEMDTWNKAFLNKVAAFEKWMYEFEKRMEK